MNDPLKQVALRLCGLRESLNYTIEEIANICHLDQSTYESFETGDVDVPISMLFNISQSLGIEITSLLSGTDPHVNHFSITRKGKGLNIDRRSAYKYESLSSTFQHRRAEPYIVEVPFDDTTELSFNTHAGQEFNYILKGRLKLYIGNREILLDEGDSIYFNPSQPHAMRAMNDLPCRFLVTIIA